MCQYYAERTFGIQQSMADRCHAKAEIWPESVKAHTKWVKGYSAQDRSVTPKFRGRQALAPRGARLAQGAAFPREETRAGVLLDLLLAQARCRRPCHVRELEALYRGGIGRRRTPRGCMNGTSFWSTLARCSHAAR